MFRKTADNDSTTQEPASTPRPKRSSGAGSRSILGPTVVFKGELSADEDLVIEGRIEGSIHHHDKNLTIGPRGSVKADINARVITIEGSVEGDLLGDEAVIIKSTAKVNGNAKGPRIIIEDGAQFSGKVETTKAKQVRADDTDEMPGLPKYRNKSAA